MILITLDFQAPLTSIPYVCLQNIKKIKDIFVTIKIEIGSNENFVAMIDEK